MTDPQYAAMAVEDLPCNGINEHWGCESETEHDSGCPAFHRAKYAVRLQSVATASHKAGAEAMREKAADLIRDNHVVNNVNGNYLAPRRRGSTEGFDYMNAIRALSLPTGEP